MFLFDLWDAFGSIALADIFDMALVAVLIYFTLLWFRRTKAAFVATGIFIFTLFYFFSKAAGMYMTSWILQGFFAIFLVALIVIFQEELRSFFEKLAVWSFGRESPSLRSKEVATLVRTLGHLAASKVGALIVLKGKDPLDRHLQGGYALGGFLSSPLLESLFDPHSDGHDGAVVIEDNRIVSFAAQLPLSRDFHKLPGMGTRHAAALGLAEKTDALCLVVSEQKGTISVAHESGIFVVPGLSDLEERIESFLSEKAASGPPPKAGPMESRLREWASMLPFFVPLPKEIRWSSLWRENLREKVEAGIFALLLWLVFVQGFKPVVYEVSMPVALQNLPEHLKVRSIRPETAQVSLEGIKRDFRKLRPKHLRLYVDLKGAQAGAQHISIAEDNLLIPDSLRFLGAEPAHVVVDLSPREEKTEVGRK